MYELGCARARSHAWTVGWGEAANIYTRMPSWWVCGKLVSRLTCEVVGP